MHLEFRAESELPRQPTSPKGLYCKNEDRKFESLLSCPAPPILSPLHMLFLFSSVHTVGTYFLSLTDRPSRTTLTRHQKPCRCSTVRQPPGHRARSWRRKHKGVMTGCFLTSPGASLRFHSQLKIRLKMELPGGRSSRNLRGIRTSDEFSFLPLATNSQ